MAHVDLTATIGDFLKLREPLWISSAHYSQNEGVVSEWADLDSPPAALTLKTSRRVIPTEEKDQVRFCTAPALPLYGRSYYCDGPKQTELLTYEQTAKLLDVALKKLERTIVGISVLADSEENYSELRSLTPGAQFAELNLKYSLRVSQGRGRFAAALDERFSRAIAEVKRFAQAYDGVPVFVKLSREMTWLPGTDELAALLDVLKAHGRAGLIVANSLKTDLPEFLSDQLEKRLKGGVMCGEHLFDTTISFIEAIKTPCAERSVPIIASGGVIDPEHVLLALRAGASAVQLCTAFVYYQPQYYQTLVWNLQNRIEGRGLTSFSTYVKRLREEGIASIYSMPFMYQPRFFGKETQKRILQDVRRSRRFDMCVMSGRTLVEAWAPVLRVRFENGLGLRLLIPRADGGVFRAVQRSWGLTDREAEARGPRLEETKRKLEELWAQSEGARERRWKEDVERRRKREVKPKPGSHVIGSRMRHACWRCSNGMGAVSLSTPALSRAATAFRLQLQPGSRFQSSRAVSKSG